MAVALTNTHGTLAGAPTATPVGVSPREELAALDAMRALAAIAVLLAHVYQLFALRGVYVRWGRPGDAGVYVFFVLSGYLIASSVVRPARFDVKGYLVRRAARIVPLYYVSILVAVVFVDPRPLLSADGWLDLGAHLLLLHGLFREFRYSMNGVWWTLSIEWMFYVLLGLLAPIFRRRRGGWVIALGMIATGLTWRAYVFLRTDDPGDAVYLVQQLPGAADLFGAGMVLALIARAGWLRRLASSATALWVVFLVSSGTVVAMLATYDQRKAEFWNSRFMMIVWPLALAVGLAGVIAVVVTRWRVIEGVARYSGLASLGKVSYGIYLFHPFVISALATAWVEQSTTIPVTTFTAVVLASTVAVAIVCHYAVERPLMEWARRKSQEPAGPTSGSPSVAPDPWPALDRGR